MHTGKPSDMPSPSVLHDVEVFWHTYSRQLKHRGPVDHCGNLCCVANLLRSRLTSEDQVETCQQPDHWPIRWLEKLSHYSTGCWQEQKCLQLNDKKINYNKSFYKLVELFFCSIPSMCHSGCNNYSCILTVQSFFDSRQDSWQYWCIYILIPSVQLRLP